MDISKVKQFAKKQGYKTVSQLKPWNGYECYEPIMDEKTTSMVGPPLLILVKGDKIRMSTPDEAFQQMDDTEDTEETTAKSFNDFLKERR